MKNIRLLICKNLQEWCGAWACFAHINESSESLTLPLLRQHQFVEKRVRQFGQAHNVSIGSIKFKKFIRYNVTEKLSLRFYEISSQFEGLDHRNKSVFIFFNSLVHSTNDSFCYRYKASCPQTIKDTLRLYEIIGHKVKPKEDLVIVIGETGMIGGGIFSILSQRKIIIAENIEDIEDNLPKLNPSSLVFALDNTSFTLDNSQRIRDVAMHYDISSGFLYCYDEFTAIWFAYKLKLYEYFWEYQQSSLVADFCSTFPQGNGDYYFSGKAEHDKVNDSFYSNLKNKHEAIALLTHSNGLDTYVGKGHTFCSRESFRNKPTKSVKVITCFRGGKCRYPDDDVEFLKSEKLIFCNVLFMCTCSGITLIDSFFEQTYAQSNWLLCSEKVNTLITSDRIMMGCPEHLLYFYFLYMCGINLGHLTNKLNEFHVGEHKEHNPFILMGDPKNAIQNPVLKKLACECKLISNDTYLISFMSDEWTKKSTKGVVLDLSNTSLAQNSLGCPIFVFEQSTVQDTLILKGLLTQNKAGLLLFLTTLNQSLPKKADILLSVNTNPYLAYANAFENMLSNLYFWQVFVLQVEPLSRKHEFLKETGSNLLSKLSHISLALIRLARDIRMLRPWHLYSSKQIDTSVKNIENLLRDLHSIMIEFCTEFIKYNSNMEYINNWRRFYVCEGEEKHFQRCPYCHCFLYQSDYICASKNSDTRVTVYCKSCQFIADVTNIVADNHITGDVYLNRGTSSVQRIKLQNKTSHKMFIDAAMCLQNHTTRQHTTISKTISQNLDVSGETELEFTIEVDNSFTPGCYALFCYVFVNGGFNLLRKIVYVQE